MQFDDRLATGSDAKEVVEAEVKKEFKYKKIDSESGFITDEVEIENFKIYQKRDVFINLMLGDYNEKGDYVLNVDMLKGLVGIKKVSTGDYNKTLFFESINSFGEKGKLKFSLTINDSKEESDVKIAVLKLLEPVKKIGGYIENTNTLIVASYKDKGDGDFIKKANKIFNIVGDDDTDNGLDDPEVVSIIMQRLKMLQDYSKAYMDNIALLEQGYYYARLELLKDPRFEAVLAEYKKHLTKGSMFISPNSPLYYAYLNELLDLSIEIVSNRNPELGHKINEAQREVVQKHNEKMVEHEASVVQNMKEVEKSGSIATVLTKSSGGKSKSSSKSSSKGGGKPSGGGEKSKGGGGKKDDKPKDKKPESKSNFNIKSADGANNKGKPTEGMNMSEVLEIARRDAAAVNFNKNHGNSNYIPDDKEVKKGYENKWGNQLDEPEMGQ